MFGNHKKNATTMIELLILLAIVGILSVMYQKVINHENIGNKYAFLQVMKNMVSYATTQTSGNQKPFDSEPNFLCNNFYNSLNTIGEKNCEVNDTTSWDISNLTTINGMRFFGLAGNFENTFKDVNPLNREFGYKFIYVDLDGVGGKNTLGKDILGFEITQNGHIRPTGRAIFDEGERSPLKGNAARDPELYSVGAYYVPENVTSRDQYKNMGNRLSYTEAQCLTGNPFPYRDNVYGQMQMCVEDDKVRKELDHPTENYEKVINGYWADIIDGRICDQLYTNEKSGAYGLVSANSTVIELCKKCYKSAYRAKYCKGKVAPGGMCVSDAFNEKGVCVSPNYVEN